MEELLIECMKSANVIELMAIGVMFWFFYRRLDAKIEKISDRVTALDVRLSDKIDGINQRLCRIEGSINTQGWLFSQTSPNRKVE